MSDLNGKHLTFGHFVETPTGSHRGSLAAWRKMKGLKSLSLITRIAIASWETPGFFGKKVLLERKNSWEKKWFLNSAFHCCFEVSIKKKQINLPPLKSQWWIFVEEFLQVPFLGPQQCNKLTLTFQRQTQLNSPQLSIKKTLVTFYYTRWFTGILMLVAYTPHVTVVEFSSPPDFFRGSVNNSWRSFTASNKDSAFRTLKIREGIRWGGVFDGVKLMIEDIKNKENVISLLRNPW